jgi:uncharacterized protein (DUF58 family)
VARLEALWRPRWEALLRVAERRLPALTRYRAPESLPIALHSRRVYILPTGFGLFFGATLVTMLLGALNFNNNSALLLTFLASGAVFASLSRTVGNLSRMELATLRALPVHAGQPVTIVLGFVARDGRGHPACAVAAGAASCEFDLPDGGGTAELALPTQRRGWLAVPRITLSSEYPLGMFRAWSVLNPDQQVLVYPAPEPQAPPLPRGEVREGRARPQPGGDDWQGLREFRLGDSRRLVAWKPSARHDRLLVKEFATPQADELVLDYDRLGALAHERRIARLTRWVLEAAQHQQPFTLALPGARIGPGHDAHHVERCLRELALLP